MDYQIESMIEDGNLGGLLDFSMDYASRVGDMLGNYRMVLAQWEESNPDLLRKLLTLTWSRLDDETRHRFLHLMIGMIYRVSKSVIWQKGCPTGEPVIAPFNFQGDEIDIDRTLECIAENRVFSYENIFVLDRKKHEKAAVIMMDASGSMQGVNLSFAAIAASSLAMNLNYKDQYGVILFSEKVNIFKRIDQPKYLDEVLSGILNILPEGRTNIGIGLSAGLEELQRTNLQHKIGILLTDGWQNVGTDPIKLALKFPRLHVINLQGGDPVLSKKIAEVGKGYFIPINDILDVSKAIVTCLK
jgi:Mg-chelatase subunit ChlD